MSYERTEQTSNKSPTSMSSASRVLQRKCACGQHSQGGECEVCAKKKHKLQRKLMVGAGNDPLEQEADRVAEHVLSIPMHSSAVSMPRIQRFSISSGEASGVAPESVDRALLSQGRPLDSTLQQEMSQRFSYDFSGVRVHTGSIADQSARELGAQAYTVKQDIVFAAGRFAPQTYSGRRLLAHEMTHVVQQRPLQMNRNIQNKQQLTSNFSGDKDVVRLKRDPDVSYKGYYTFNLMAGGTKEVAVQFYYPGSGNKVKVKMASLRKSMMVEDEYILSDPAKFSPTINYEDGVTTFFDLTGDDQKNIEAHVTKDALYSVEFLTAESNPGDPKYQRHEITNTFAVMSWEGVRKVINVSQGENQQVWVIRPHPHPNVQFMYYNTVTREAFIPSVLSSNSKFKGVRSGKSAIKNKDVTVLDWGDSWNGFNVAGGVLTWGQIDVSSVEGMVKSIENELEIGSCIGSLTIIGHGSPGSISVGDGTGNIAGKHIRGGALDSTSDIYDAAMANLLARLTPKFCDNGKAVLRGCNVGDGKLGESFSQLLANLWQVEVKAHIGTIRGGGYWTTGKWKQAAPADKTQDN